MYHGGLLICTLTQRQGFVNTRPPCMAEAKFKVPMVGVIQCTVQKVHRDHAKVSQEFLCHGTDLTSDFQTMMGRMT